MISESWLKPTILDSVIHINGYTLFRKDREHRVGGGVCLYLVDVITSSFSVTVGDVNIPGIDVIHLCIAKNSFSINLVCLYRPPDTHRENDILLIDKLWEMSELDNLILVGDFNFPEIVWKTTSLSDGVSSHNVFQNFILNSNLSQLIEEPTRFRINNQPSTLDLILTNDDNLLTTPEISSPIGKSDHAVITTHIQFNVNSSPGLSNTLTYNYTDFDKVNDDLSQLDWHSVLNLSIDPSTMWNTFLQITSKTISVNTTQRKISKNNLKPWINNQAIHLIRHKRHLWRKYKQTRLTVDFSNHRNYSNRVKVLLDNLRHNFEESIIASGNSKKVFKYIRSSLSSKVAIPLLLKDDGSLCSSNKETSEILSLTFSKVFTNELPNDNMPDIISPRLFATLDNILFTNDKIKQHLLNLRTNASPGLDGLTPYFLKRCSDALATPLCLIMQSSFTNGSLPSSWKLASVTPIFKRGNKLDSHNYRPISLLPVVSKLMESIISETMMDFLLEQHIIPKQQQGFIPGRSTLTNLLHCVNDWTSFLNNREPIDIVYLDFSKAFDRVPKRRLLYKLEHFGIRGNLKLWIENFLTDRFYKVRVGDSFSHKRPVKSGVPQGSVLGPLLFTVYTSDLPFHVSSKISQYADDSKIYDNPITSHLAIQNDLMSIHQWSSEWLLPLNIEKCVVLHVGKNNPHFDYFIDGQIVITVTSHNDLGVIVNSELSWSDHVLSVTKRANTRLYLIRKCFSKVSFQSFCKLYATYVRPILEYAGPVWYPDLTRDRTLLESVQRKATRVAFGPCVT